MIATFAFVCGAGLLGASPQFTLECINGQADLGYIEIHGVAAGEFDPAFWQANTLHLVPDLRRPLLAPERDGIYRNIYAPSAVRTPDGWRLFYGAWDGVPTGNDRIYSRATTDFLVFGPREVVIEHGEFIHACNVNAMRRPDGAIDMMCTVYPDKFDRNKPAYFFSADGRVWNESPAPHEAKQADIVRIDGYEGYDNADINGVNVLLREDDAFRLYFNDYKNFGRVYRASGTDGRTYTFEGPALDCSHAVNDVKKLAHGGRTWYLMGLHMNTDGLWYSLSNDGRHFETEHPLCTSLDAAERYIVALGFVVDGNRVLGALYGAGEVPELNRNRLFARWIQRKVVFTSEDGTRCEPERALGPDRQIIPIKPGMNPKGTFQVYAEDGLTPLGDPIPANVGPPVVYQLHGEG